MAANVKKGDMVQIIAGSHKGATGKVLRVIPDRQLLVIEGHNRKYKHVRPSRRNPQGGRIQVERPVHMSNVLPVNPKTSKGTRVHYTVSSDGGKKRVALDGTEIGVVVR
jgi:large subunit ribosomal protein L24